MSHPHKNGSRRSSLPSKPQAISLIGGDASVANQHCANVSPFRIVMQYLFATQEPQKMHGGANRCKTGRLCKSSGFLKNLPCGLLIHVLRPAGWILRTVLRSK